MVEAAKRPWWKKKRWITALLVWLALIYPAMSGPVWCGVVWGWLPPWLGVVLIDPLLRAAADLPDAVSDVYYSYLAWWQELGKPDG